MKILFIHDPPDLYGASRSLLRLVSRLAKDGHEVLVVVPYDGPLCPLLETGGIHVKTCRGNRHAAQIRNAAPFLLPILFFSIVNSRTLADRLRISA